MSQSVGLVACPSASVFALTGEDRKGWLQGQVTQDLRDRLTGSCVAACLCTPTGQLEAILHIYFAEDTLYIVTDQGDKLCDRVDQFVVLEDVQLETLAHGISSYQGADATKLLSESASLPTIDYLRTEEALYLRRDRTGFGGWDVVQFGKTKLPTAEPISEDALFLAGLEAGIPVFGVDINEKTLPPELGKSFEFQTISYKKGCYTGQEVLQRIHTRGHTNQTWVGIFCDSEVKAGDEITMQGEPVGKVTRAGFSPRYGAIAAGFVKNRAAYDGTLVKVGNVAAEVAFMPIHTVD